MTKIISAFLLFTVGILHAQTSSGSQTTANTENLKYLGSGGWTSNIQTFDNRYEGVKGSPNVFAEWQSGRVFFRDGDHVNLDALNYNCFDNEIVFRDTEGQLRTLNLYKVDSLVFVDESRRVFTPVRTDPGKAMVFAERIYLGKSHAYLLHSKDFLRASTDGGYSPDRRNDEFVDKQELYFQKHDDGRMYRLKKSRKYILQCFPDKESEIKAFLKSEKPDLKSPAGLSALLTFYDSL